MQHDFLFGENGAQKLNNDDLYQLTELNKVLKPSLRDQDFSSKLEAGSEVIVKLFGKKYTILLSTFIHDPRKVSCITSGDHKLLF